MKKETEASGSAASSAEHAGGAATAAESTTSSPPKKVLKRFESMNDADIERLRSQLHERDLALNSKNSYLKFSSFEKFDSRTQGFVPSQKFQHWFHQIRRLFLPTVDLMVHWAPGSADLFPWAINSNTCFFGHSFFLLTVDFMTHWQWAPGSLGFDPACKFEHWFHQICLFLLTVDLNWHWTPESKVFSLLWFTDTVNANTDFIKLFNLPPFYAHCGFNQGHLDSRILEFVPGHKFKHVISSHTPFK